MVNSPYYIILLACAYVAVTYLNATRQAACRLCNKLNILAHKSLIYLLNTEKDLKPEPTLPQN